MGIHSQSDGMEHMRYIRNLLLALALLLPVACGDTAKDAAPEVAATDMAPVDTAATGTEAEQTNVQVEEFKYSLLPGGVRVLTGTLYNPTSIPIRNAQIQVSLFDDNNRRISSMTISVRDVPPGARKSFREPVDSDEVDNVKGAKVRSVLVM